MAKGYKSDLATEDPHSRFGEGCLFRMGKAMGVGAASGIIMGCVGLMWYPDPIRVGHKGFVEEVAQDLPYIMRGLKMPLVWGTMVLGTFSGVECLFENLRDPKKESTYVNAMAGGAAAGALMGTMSKRFDIVAATSVGMALLMGMAEYNDQRIAIDPQHARVREDIRISLKEEESDTLKALKEKYPKYKDL